MANSKTTSKALMEFLAAPESEPAPDSAFSKHGLWAPGVGLMRNLQFGSKALVIGLMFLIPLAWTAYGLFSAKLDAISFSTKESEGVAYEREVFPLLNVAQQMRMDGTAKADPASAKSKLIAVEKRLGASLDSAGAYGAVEKAFAEAQKASAADSFKANTQHVKALLDLTATVGDNSNLTLDPDIDSYYLMDAALFRMPVIVESAGKLRDLGLLAMKAGSVSAQQQQEFAALMGLAEFQAEGLRAGLKKALTYNKELGGQVQADKALKDTAVFFALARKTLLDAQDLSPAAQAAFLAAANTAINDHYELNANLLQQLDAVISKRVSGLRFDIYSYSSVLLVGLLLAGYLFYSFYLVNRGGLNLISEHLKEMAQGDLRKAPAKPWGKDEPATVIKDLRVVYDSLHLLIRKVRHGAHALNAASDEIASASVDLSARTEAAAAALEQQAASMEEMSSTVSATADRAQMATAFAHENAQVAERGGQVFGEVVTTMKEIQVSSNRIGDIIGVIDAIAFQTNILALNAAVEAARAGESGRGFAVVATEVRSLAGRSAKAAQEIKTLISASVRQVDVGTNVIEEASRSMQEVVTNARQINQFLTEIATSAREQAAGVQEVGRSIQDLDKSTQQNAALVEETTAASGALAELAGTLQDEIANFKVA